MCSSDLDEALHLGEGVREVVLVPAPDRAVDGAVELGRVLSIGDAEDRKVSLMADPRELHVARQLVLKSAGFRDKNTTGTSPKVVDFSSEKSVKEECRAYCGPGVDLDQGVPLFTLKDLNATMKGSDVIQPWFLSFADLVRAYVNSTTADEGAVAYQLKAEALKAQMAQQEKSEKALSAATRPIATVLEGFACVRHCCLCAD